MSHQDSCISLFLAIIFTLINKRKTKYDNRQQRLWTHVYQTHTTEEPAGGDGALKVWIKK